MQSDLVKHVCAEIDSLLTHAGLKAESAAIARRAALDAVPQILEDLEALATRDTAARDTLDYVWRSYLCFRALLAYRVAHAILCLPEPGLEGTARRITEDAKARTGVDIHPGADIGRRMIIDHGWGTVIGEQARVGDDCYFLQNVTLGCRRIGRSYPEGQRRHPTIGNRVVLAGDVWVLGPVTIGDDCRIDPGARITTDIPAGAHVRVITKLQVTQVADISGLDTVATP